MPRPRGMPNERPRDFRAEGVSGEGAGNSMRGSCAPQIERDAFALIINPIELPLAVALVTTHHNAAVQLQVSEMKTDAGATGRNLRSAVVVCAVLSASGSSPLGTADSAAFHENGSIRNVSGRCVSSKTGVPTRSVPSRAVKRARVSDS